MIYFIRNLKILLIGLASLPLLIAGQTGNHHDHGQTRSDSAVHSGLSGMADMFGSMSGSFGEWGSTGATAGGMGFDEMSEDETNDGPGQYFDFNKIIKLLNSEFMKNIPDVRRMLPTLVTQGLRFYKGLIDSVPGLIRRTRPQLMEMLSGLSRAKGSSMKFLFKNVEKMKSILIPKWRKEKIDLELVERSVSFCPAKNVSIVRSQMQWPSFANELMDLCIELGCDGKYDLCCPYLEMELKATCVHSHKKHFGICPKGSQTAFFDQITIEKLFQNDRASFPTCTQDSDCQVTQRCCMKDGVGPRPIASCLASIRSHQPAFDKIPPPPDFDKERVYKEAESDQWPIDGTAEQR